MERKILFEGNEIEVNTRLLIPENPFCIYVFGHGAGAGIEHEFIITIQKVLFKKGIATFTFNFQYKEKGKKLPSRKDSTDNEYRAVWKYILEHYSNYPLFAGGKSMGGRVSTRVAHDLLNVRGLIFLGFPIHSPNNPDMLVGNYIKQISIPMLFLQGSKDPFSYKSAAEKLVSEIPEATLHWLEGGKHSWETTKKNPKNQQQLIDEGCSQILEFCKKHLN